MKRRLRASNTSPIWWPTGPSAIRRSPRCSPTHGRSGVPLYLYYAPGAAEPEVLPQILTEGEVLAALEP